jgi:hypothetical protein
MRSTERIMKCAVLYSSSDMMWTTDTDCDLSEMSTKWLLNTYDHYVCGGALSCQEFIYVYFLYIIHSSLKIFVLFQL